MYVIPSGGGRMAFVIAFVFLGLPAWAQTSPQPQSPQSNEVESPDDPTRAVFFSVRNEYFNLRGDDWTHASIFRSDRVLLKERQRLGGKVGLLTRFDLPVVAAGADGETRVGLGDLYAQVVHVPWLTRHFALAMGAGVTFPTATDSTLGLGKWQFAPIVGPIWFFPRGKGFALLRLHEHVSFAGDSTRPEVNYLQTVQTVMYNFKKGWWVLFDTEARTDWHDQHRVSFHSGLELGHVIVKRMGLSVKPEIPWGGNRRGDWAMKVILTRYRQP
jgi:hypothetical protein